MVVYVDSSVFVSSWIATDINCEASRKFFLQAEEKAHRIAISELVLYEIANVVTRLGEVNRLEWYLEPFLSEAIDIVPLSSRLFAYFKILASQIRIKTSDLIICATAAMAESPLVTWDQNILKVAARSKLQCYAPSSFFNSAPEKKGE
jgi:predicted nucleic acid-binding protein